MVEPTRLTTNVDGVTVQRERLHTALIAFEDAIAAGAGGRTSTWRANVVRAVGEVQDAFRLHVDFTEGDGGLYDEILAAAPRLAAAVGSVREEHATIFAALAEVAMVLDDDASDPGGFVERCRDSAGRALGILVRHRQRGADLTYAAFEDELGGDG